MRTVTRYWAAETSKYKTKVAFTGKKYWSFSIHVSRRHRLLFMWDSSWDTTSRTGSVLCRVRGHYAFCQLKELCRDGEGTQAEILFRFR